MISSMSLEDKFEALMKSYQTIASSNLELVNNNSYLRRQIEENAKRTKKVIKSPSSPIQKDDGESSTYSSRSSHEKESPRRTPRREWRPHSHSNDFRVYATKFEGKLYPYDFLEWLHTIERIFTRKYQMTRKLNLLLLDYANRSPYGGLTFVVKGLDIEKKRFDHGRR